MSGVANGTDLSEIRKQARAEATQAAENQSRVSVALPIADSFDGITRQGLESTAHSVHDFTHHKKPRRFESYVFPEIGFKAHGHHKRRAAILGIGSKNRPNHAH